MVLKCEQKGCDHEYQDKMYGKGMRVHNPCNASPNEKAYRCTVCENIRTMTSTKVAGGKKSK